MNEEAGDYRKDISSQWIHQRDPQILCARLQPAFETAARSVLAGTYRGAVFVRGYDIETDAWTHERVRIQNQFASLARKYGGYLTPLTYGPSAETAPGKKPDIYIDGDFPLINQEARAMAEAYGRITNTPKIRALVAIEHDFTMDRHAPVLLAHWKIAGQGGPLPEGTQNILEWGDWGFFQAGERLPIPKFDPNNASMTLIIRPV